MILQKKEKFCGGGGKILRKIFISLLAIVFVVCISLAAACGTKSFTVTFNGNGGTLVEGEEVWVVRKAADIVAPKYEKEGYDFDGWDTVIGDITEDKTVTAQWKEIKSFTLSFDYNGGSNDGVSSIVCNYGAIIKELPEPKKTGFTFIGWRIGSQEGTRLNSGETWTFRKNITVCAAWKENSNGKRHSIIYNMGGGSFSTNDYPHCYVEGTTETLVVPEREGYTFNGWKISGTDETIENTADKNGTLYVVATWNGGEATLFFDYNGGVGTENSLAVKYGEKIGELPLPVKTDCTFCGWNTSADGSGEYVDKGGVWLYNNDVTVYAVWKDGKGYSIIYDLAGGAFKGKVDENQRYYNDSYGRITLPSAAKTGSEFSHWRELDENGNLINSTVHEIQSTDKGNRFFQAVYNDVLHIAVINKNKEGQRVAFDTMTTDKKPVATSFDINVGDSIASRNYFLPDIDVLDDYKIKGWQIYVNGVYKPVTKDTRFTLELLGVSDVSEIGGQIELYPILQKLWVGPY